MSAHVVRLADCPAQAWRNGGGTTRELLRWPTRTAPEGPDDWSLRVSVAEIERDGPFSPFPGVERWFAVLQGPGVWLSGIEGVVAAGAAPVHFAGEAPPACRLVDGPTRDLNLMQRRGSGTASMQLATVGELLSAPGAWAWRGLYAHEPARIDTGGGPKAVEAATLLWSDAGNSAPWRLLEGGRAYWMHLRS